MTYELTQIEGECMSTNQAGVDVVVSAFPRSAQRALAQLGYDELIDTTAGNMGLKALLYLIGISEISHDHDKISESMHRAMQKHAWGDYTVYALYDQAVINLHEQKKSAAEKIAQLAKEEEAAREKVEEDRLNLEVMARQVEEIETTRGELFRKEEELNDTNARLAARTVELLQRESNLMKREAAFRKRRRKQRK